MTERIFNFSAGPAVLPVSVLERAREEMLSLPGGGMSVMEISERSKPLQAIRDGGRSGRAGPGRRRGRPPVSFQGGRRCLVFVVVPVSLLRGGGAPQLFPAGR